MHNCICIRMQSLPDSQKLITKQRHMQVVVKKGIHFSAVLFENLVVFVHFLVSIPLHLGGGALQTSITKTGMSTDLLGLDT